MARTEKKFGQVNQAAAGSSTELVSTSSNRRNVLVNITGRGSSTATLFTTTGSPVPTTQLSIGSFKTPTAIVGATANSNTIGLAINPSKSRFLQMHSAANSYVYTSITPSHSGLTLGGSNTYAHSTSWQAIDASQNAAGQDLSNSAVHSSRTVWIDDTYIIVFQESTGTGATTSAAHKYGMLAFAAGTLQSITTNYTTPSGLTDSTMRRKCAVALQRPTTSTGVGYILAMHQDPNLNTNAVELMGMYLFASGAESGRVWWNGTGTTNQVAGRAAQFFLGGDYNHVNPVFAFPHTTNASDPWLNVTASGGSGTIATNLPKIPSGASNAGFRLVANDGAFGTERRYLDGTVSYPAAPTGVTIPTASASSSQVQSLKFSPNGQYLAVMYNREGITVSSVANSVVVIYTRQENGTYVHTHSSGSAIPRSGYGNDTMCWSSDSSSIYVAVDSNQAPGGTAGQINVWNPFAGTSSVLTANASVVNVAYTKYPYVPSYYGPTTPTSGSLTTSATVASGSTINNSGATINSVFHIPVSGTAGIVVVPALGVALDQTTVEGTNITLTTGTQTTAPNYVNTVGQSIAVASGSVTQLSNIVLESGESLYIEPTVGDVVDAVAYGVEIS